MRTLIRGIPLTLAAALIALLAIACSSGGSGDTAREISDEELAQMVLALEDFGEPYAALQAREGGGLFETLEQRAQEEFDPADEAQDLEQFGWVLGYGAEFLDPKATGEGSGVYIVGSVVDLFEDAEGASGYFNDTLTELSEMAGTTSQGFTTHEVETFGADVGDESAGFDIQGSVEDGAGSTLDIWFSVLSFRHGRLVGTAVFVTFEQRSFEDGLKGLASVMDQRITSVLAGAAVSHQP